MDHTMSNSAKKIGGYTKYQREKKGYSLNEFARLCNFTSSFLLKLERGDYHNVKFDVIEKISNALDMSIEDFLIKCQITSGKKKLDSLDYYFKESYQFPEEAISDLKLFIQLLQKKYKTQIKELKEAHKKYWEEKTK